MHFERLGHASTLVQRTHSKSRDGGRSLRVRSMSLWTKAEEVQPLCPKPTNDTRTMSSSSQRHRTLGLVLTALLGVAVCVLWIFEPSFSRRPFSPAYTQYQKAIAPPTRAVRKLPPTDSLPLVADLSEHSAATLQGVERVMDIYCHGPLLHAVQMAGVFPDSKHFVDMPIKRNSSVFQILVDFERQQLAMTRYLSRTASYERLLRRFLDDHFDPPGTDLLPVTPYDYHEYVKPPMIAAIPDQEQRDWAMALYHLWKHLGRVPNTQVVSSFLHATARRSTDSRFRISPNVLIVPGGRFRESYYWDSYWIVQGLLVSDMAKTARGVVNNLLQYVAEFGFVPNGGRVYYLTRSQPPLLSDMVNLVALNGTDEDGHSIYDSAYLNVSLPILEREYQFWMQRGPGAHAVELTRSCFECKANRTFVLNRYISMANRPRPESYREDVSIASEIYGDTTDDGHDLEAKKDRYYNDLTAAAESGWDFSSRWFRDPMEMRTIETSEVVPVDLNAFLYRMERNMVTFYDYLDNHERAAYFVQAAEDRFVAMNEILWSEEEGTWKDFLLENNTHSSVVSVSDYSPLWANAFDATNTTRLERILDTLKSSGLLKVGGIQTTTTMTGQQWDAPNAWPPEQDIVIEGLLAMNLSAAHDLARSLTQTWVHSSLAAWRETGLMFEKYNASSVGALGVGGEYFPQFGFGWTNGVILKFLTIYRYLLQ